MLFKKKNELDYISFMSGVLTDLEKVNDPVFSTRMMGDGYAIVPDHKEVYAPCDGEITIVFPTKHAYGMKTKDDKEVLLHLGLDTVELQGNGFKSMVSVGDKVQTGDLIATMDLDYILSNGKSSTSMLIFTSGEKIKLLKEGQEVNMGEDGIFTFID